MQKRTLVRRSQTDCIRRNTQIAEGNQHSPTLLIQPVPLYVNTRDFWLHYLSIRTIFYNVNVQLGMTRGSLSHTVSHAISYKHSSVVYTEVCKLLTQLELYARPCRIIRMQYIQQRLPSFLPWMGKVSGVCVPALSYPPLGKAYIAMYQYIYTYSWIALARKSLQPKTM